MIQRRPDLFYYDCWYAAAWSTDLKNGGHLARTFLNEPVILFRTQSGIVGALEDRCCHRALPLSCGHVEGEIIRCVYHGLEFNVTGQCVRIPQQEQIPRSVKVRSYPLVEQDGLLWIWMGAPEKADSAHVPRHENHVNPNWGWRSTTFHLVGNWRLLIDNLMDLSHLPYIHAKTIGGNPELHFKTRTDAVKLENGVRVQRHMPNSVPPPTYVDAKGFKGLVDRWQEIEFHPMFLRINAGACDANTGAYEAKRDHGLSMVNFHGVTPETERTTHYIWSTSTNILENGTPDIVFKQTEATFLEDQFVLEQQQQRIESDPNRAMLYIASDTGCRMARELVDTLLKAQTVAA